jgi:hypothetical protein
MSITPKAIQDLLDELEASKQSRLRAWNVLQRLRSVLSELGNITIPAPAQKTFDAEGEILEHAFTRSFRIRNEAIKSLCSSVSGEAGKEVLVPFAADRMKAWPISSRVIVQKMTTLKSSCRVELESVLRSEKNAARPRAVSGFAEPTITSGRVGGVGISHVTGRYLGSSMWFLLSFARNPPKSESGATCAHRWGHRWLSL